MMKSDTDLDLVFKNAVGKKVILNIEEPTTGGDIVEAVEGRLRTTTLDVVE